MHYTCGVQSYNEGEDEYEIPCDENNAVEMIPAENIARNVEAKDEKWEDGERSEYTLDDYFSGF